MTTWHFNTTGDYYLLLLLLLILLLLIICWLIYLQWFFIQNLKKKEKDVSVYTGRELILRRDLNLRPSEDNSEA